MEKERRERLPLLQKLLYSSASAGLNIMSITVGTWILYFYAPPADSGRVQYLPVTLVGVLLTVGSLWDALIDPFIGHFSDTLRSRWGRRRPFLIFGAPLTALTLILIWTPPQGSTALTAVYFFGVTLLFYTSFSLMGIPYDGSMPEMASDPEELVTLSTWKSVFGVLGVMIGSLVAAPLFDAIGPLAMGVVVAAVGLVTIWLTLTALRERAQPAGEPIGVVEGLKSTLRNRQFLIMFISVLIVHVAYAMILANMPYFVTLVVGGAEADVGLFQGVLVLAMLLSAPLWNWLAGRYANRKLLMVTMVGIGVTAALNYPVGQIGALSPMVHGLIAAALIGPMLSGYFILAYAMMGSVVDYDELFTHRRREAVYYGTFSLAAGLGPSLAALLLPLLLERFGYTEANPLGVRLAWLLTGAIAWLGALAFAGYRLEDSPEETRRNLGLADVVQAD